MIAALSAKISTKSSAKELHKAMSIIKKAKDCDECRLCEFHIPLEINTIQVKI